MKCVNIDTYSYVYTSKFYMDFIQNYGKRSAISAYPLIVVIFPTVLHWCSLDAEYWQKMTTVIGSSEEHVWDALTEGFEKYLSVLTERAALIQETGALEQQVLFKVEKEFKNGGPPHRHLNQPG